MDKNREIIRSFIEKNLSITDSLSVTFLMSRDCKSEYQSIENFRYFLNILNKKIFGNAYRKFKKGVQVIPTLEWSESVGYHYHIQIEVPNHINKLDFIKHINNAWGKTKFANLKKPIKISGTYNNGWSNYMTKFNNLKSDIDWSNAHLNSRV